MSFIDLMGNDVWTWADIDNRARAMVSSVVPREREDELQTLAIGALMGRRVPTAKEQGEMNLVQAIKEQTGALIVQSRIDLALLLEVLPLEIAQRRLAQAAVFLPDPDHAGQFLGADPIDAAERAAVQAIVSAATPEALALALLRNPLPPEPVVVA